MTPDLVSVVMPVFNGERFLAAAVESVLSQGYEPLELVAVDDGSTDGSAGILERVAAEDGRVRVVSQANQGHAGALNAALEQARGEFVAVLDCDDEALPGRLEAQVEALHGDKALAAVGGGVVLWSEESGDFFTTQPPTEAQQLRRALETTPGCPLLHSAVTMRREAVLALGGYRPGLTLALDYDLWLRVIERYDVANLARPVVRYRIHDLQTTGTKTEQVAIENAAARVAARIRRAGGRDPVPQTRLPVDDLVRLVGVSEHDVAVAVVDYASWYARTALAAGQPRVAAETFALAERYAASSGDPALAAHVASARLMAEPRSRIARARAAATRPVRRLLGRA